MKQWVIDFLSINTITFVLSHFWDLSYKLKNIFKSINKKLTTKIAVSFKNNILLCLKVIYRFHNINYIN
jgi:hypothetical protein